MPVVILPTVLRRHAQGQARFEVPARTVRQSLRALEQLVPGIGAELFDTAGELRGYVRLYVNQVELTDAAGWDAPLQPDDEIAIIAMMMGGSQQIQGCTAL